nr:translation initiation factor IF-2-like [Pongo abelii]
MEAGGKRPRPPPSPGPGGAAPSRLERAPRLRCRSERPRREQGSETEGAGEGGSACGGARRLRAARERRAQPPTLPGQPGPRGGGGGGGGAARPPPRRSRAAGRIQMRRPSRTGPAAPGRALGREDVQATAPGHFRRAGGAGTPGSAKLPAPRPQRKTSERAVRWGIRSPLRRDPAPGSGLPVPGWLLGLVWMESQLQGGGVLRARAEHGSRTRNQKRTRPPSPAGVSPRTQVAPFPSGAFPNEEGPQLWVGQGQGKG